LETTMTATLSRAGKLDTAQVNGLRDDDLVWDAVGWRSVEDDVQRLRQRIFKASQDGDLKRVRHLQNTDARGACLSRMR